MDSPGALMRANQMKENLRGMDELAERHSANLRAELAPATVDRILTALRTEWLPVRLDVEMTEAVDRVLGRALLRRWSKTTILDATQGPLLSPLIEGATALFGLTPTSVFKLLPRGWSSLYRGCGELTVGDRAPERARVSWTGVPAELHASEAYHHGIAASLAAVLELTKVEGTVEPEVKGANRVDFVARWTSPATPST